MWLGWRLETWTRSLVHLDAWQDQTANPSASYQQTVAPGEVSVCWMCPLVEWSLTTPTCRAGRDSHCLRPHALDRVWTAHLMQLKVDVRKVRTFELVILYAEYCTMTNDEKLAQFLLIGLTFVMSRTILEYAQLTQVHILYPYKICQQMQTSILIKDQRPK